jgi:hypothetical protein
MKLGIASFVVLLAAVIGALVWWQRPSSNQIAPVEPSAIAEVSSAEPTAQELARPADIVRETVDVPKIESSPVSAAPVGAPSSTPTLDLAKLSEAELEAEADRLEGELSKVTTPILQAMIDAGRGEVLDPPNSYNFRRGDNETILFVQFPPAGKECVSRSRARTTPISTSRRTGSSSCAASRGRRRASARLPACAARNRRRRTDRSGRVHRFTNPRSG